MRLVSLGGFGLIGLACDRGPMEPELAPPPPPDVRAYVAGPALENLDANGHFRLPRPVVHSPYATISAEQAGAIAMGVIQTWYANPDVITFAGPLGLVEAAELQHGAPIDWQAVRGGSRRAYFAESHLEPLPDSLGNPTIRHFGPHFLVPLFVGATPVVGIAVSAYATNVFLDDRGFVLLADNLDGGGEFAVSGVPLSMGGITIPPAPEAAVEFAFAETGSKIVDVPVLGMPGNRITRTAARWHLRLAELMTFERIVDGQVVVSDEVYVGHFPSIADARLADPWDASGIRLRLYVAAAMQPTVESLGSIDLPLQPGYAVDLHEVRLRE